MFLVVKYHIIRPPPRLPGLACLIAQSRKNLWDIEFQKIMDHEFQKIHGPWISKKSWTMNFQKSWDIDFQKFLDVDIFCWKIFRNLRKYVLIKFFKYRFCVILLILLILLIFWKPLKKSWHLFFLFKVYYSPDNWREREIL